MECLVTVLLMLEPSVLQMAFPCSPKHSGLAIALCLLLLIYWSYYSIHLTSMLLTLLLLVLSTFFPLLGQLGKACFKEKPSEAAAAAALPQDVVFADQRAAMEEFVAYHNDEAVSGSEDPSLKYELTSGLLSVEALSSQETLSQSTLQCSNSSDESLLEDACHLKESFEGSISDDENLIEIIMPDYHFVLPEASKASLKPLPDISRGLLTNLVPEPVLGQHGLMELLSETSEDDNLIEIDITRGCVKCSRMGIMACII